MRRWLARLSFSFLILAVVLAWDAYSSLRGRGRAVRPWRVHAQFATAAVLVVLGLAGARARHQMLRDDADEAGRPENPHDGFKNSDNAGR